MKLDSIIAQVKSWVALQNQGHLLWAASGLIIVFLFSRPIAKLCLTITFHVTSRLGLTVSKEVHEAILPATQMIIQSIGWLVALSLLVLPDGLQQVLERIVYSVLVAAVFAAIYALIDPISVAFSQRHKEDSASLGRDWIEKIVQLAVLILAVASLLDIWGIKIGSAMTGLGVFGAAMALAAQDFVNNMLSGMSNMSEGRFKEGDFIQMEDGEVGTVERIELRSTLLRRLDQGRIYVPNNRLANGKIINFATRHHRHLIWNIPLRQDTTPKQLEQIRDGLTDFVHAGDDFLNTDDFPARVRVSTTTEHSIELLVEVFTRTSDYTEYLVVQERLVLKCIELAETAGAAFACTMSELLLTGNAAAKAT